MVRGKLSVGKFGSHQFSVGKICRFFILPVVVVLNKIIPKYLVIK
ncbi:hypothetical protein [Mesoaciditoga lauensis]|nr:hypothetical protein [Mesoaciditoga lauensis]